MTREHTWVLSTGRVVRLSMRRAFKSARRTARKAWQRYFSTNFARRWTRAPKEGPMKTQQAASSGNTSASDAPLHLVQPQPGLYLCSRTSQMFDVKPPCDGAFRVSRVRVDCRTVPDPRMIPAYRGSDEWWYSEGTNHRVEGGEIKRDLGTETSWAVKIEDVDAFVDKHGMCIFSRDDLGFRSVEIYDDYRE